MHEGLTIFLAPIWMGTHAKDIAMWYFAELAGRVMPKGSLLMTANRMCVDGFFDFMCVYRQYLPFAGG